MYLIILQRYVSTFSSLNDRNVFYHMVVFSLDKYPTPEGEQFKTIITVNNTK